ncbi:MAG: aspartate--tRNA ligase [Bacteroidetes bacterium]|uniref:Aspartate--tRNA ligase n=1 Tax=Candidatus Pullibacteroides excrementavium TaxID=2840905 RepID=A0A9D9H2R3_9BACT|nr:aspartate--tRNA ligase [Candidatus Pullibacteroides excrementavium]
MYRTHTNGELRISDVGKEVCLCGWVQRSRDLGGMTFVDLRDRYGITQVVFNMETNADLCAKARTLGREFVVQIKGKVAERSNKNNKIPTGDIEIIANEINILNPAKTPPFTIEDHSDGGDELRMKYRYLDLRRDCVRKNLELRHRLSIEIRKYMDGQGFMEIETPFLVKSTPEGARDFVVPSRMNPGEFYALPQSPQQYKQLLMVAGYDRYFQLVRCFRDEDLRADRQPEFTQLDCEMSFVEQEDVLQMFEGLIRYLFKVEKGIDVPPLQRMSWQTAMDKYGSDKPDLRFGMEFTALKEVFPQGKFSIFDQSEWVGGICVPGGAEYTRKQLDELTDFVKRPQVGASGLIYIKCNADGSFKSSVDKFFNADELKAVAQACDAKAGDLILILAGKAAKTKTALGVLRLEMGNRLGLRDPFNYKLLWVVDFPLLEWDEEAGRFFAMHHPFTAPKPEDDAMLETDPGKVRANAYDMVINGVEVGGGSIRIHDKNLQKRMFKALGFSDEEAQAQFGFLMNAFEYGAPPHGGLAFGFDRLCALFGGADSIRDYIAFPKNNAGRDTMSESPSPISQAQLDELNLKVNLK